MQKELDIKACPTCSGWKKCKCLYDPINTPKDSSGKCKLCGGTGRCPTCGGKGFVKNS